MLADYFNPNPSPFMTASHSTRSSLSRVGYRYNPNMLKHVRAVGYREASSPRHVMRMDRLVAPMAGILSLPVINDRILRWDAGCVFSKNSQNHWTTGSFSGCALGQLSYDATAFNEGTSSGSSDPRTSSSISSDRKSESAFPPHTVKNPRLNGWNCRVTDTSSSCWTYRSTNSRRFALVTCRFSPPSQRGTATRSPYRSSCATKS